TATCEELAACAQRQGVTAAGLNMSDPDEWLNLRLVTTVEPNLGQPAPALLFHYPAPPASLAPTRIHAAIELPERIELYWQGVELANGYYELTDAVELRNRLTAVNAARVADGRPALPLPESLLAAMEQGLPPSAGCALGFDRLVMLAV